MTEKSFPEESPEEFLRPPESRETTVADTSKRGSDEPEGAGPAAGGAPDVTSAEHGGDTGLRHLSEEAVNAWRISGGLTSLTYWLAPAGYGAIIASGASWPLWPAYAMAALVLVLTILAATVIPWIRWKRWRYRVDRHEIYLQRGLFIVRKTLIPIRRVQHVDTRQGPVYRQFNLASVDVTTAGDTHEIPALAEPVADELRHLISEYARVAREDL